ncbi:MAG: HEAT repeat domain-containing protein, partial [Candidatus Eremiobacterales bacterium]
MVATACVALPLAIAAAPPPAPSGSHLALPSPSPNASATAAPAPTPTPVMNVLPPPSPTVPDTTTLGKIGDLERAGAGPLKASAHHPVRATSPSQLASYLKDSDPQVQARAAIAIGRLRYASGVGPLVEVLQSQTASD